MSRLIAAVIMSSTRVNVTAASIFHPTAPPQWRLCTEAVVAKGVDPLLVVERLLSLVGAEVDVMLIHQSEARRLLLRRYAHDSIVLVQQPHVKSRALWTPLMPKEWAPLLMAHWRVADLVYAYTRRLYQAAALGIEQADANFFDRFKYKPCSSKPTATTDGENL
jgi:hypothetical protein